MESDSRDRYESDNLIWQLEITFKKLSAICRKNAKLVDYINKKVDVTVSEWRNSKDNFKKLTWAEMDDSDLDLDLDITLPSPLSIIKSKPFKFITIQPNITTKGEHITPPNITPNISPAITPREITQSEGIIDDMEAEQSISQIDDNAANPDDKIANNMEGNINNEMVEMEQTVIALINTTIAEKNTVENKTKNKPTKPVEIDPISSTYFVQENPLKKSQSSPQPKAKAAISNTKKLKKNKKENVNQESISKDEWSTVAHSKNSKKKKKKKMKGRLMFVQQKLLRRKKKMAATEKSENEKAEKKKEEQRLRMKRAEKRKSEQQKMLKQKHKKLTSKLKEIKLNHNMQKKNMVNAIKERQIKAEKKKKQIKNNKKKQIIRVNKKLKILEKLNEKETKQMEENLNKRFQNAANQRHQNQLLIQARRNSLSMSREKESDDLNDYTCTLEGDNENDNCNHNHKHRANEMQNKYIDMNSMKRLSGKFLYIPRIVRKSSASCNDLYASIENLYNNTNNILLGKEDKRDIEYILKIWLKGAGGVNFTSVKYNKDVLLAANRLICFDVNKLNIKSARLMVKVLILLCKNKMGLEFLALKYTFKLLVYYKFCLGEYFFKGNAIYKSLLPQLSVILVKVFAFYNRENGNNINGHGPGDKEYKKFKKQTQSFLLLNVYKSECIIFVGSVLKAIGIENNYKIIDGILNSLMEIPLIVNNGIANVQICDLIRGQIESTQCTQIIHFTYGLATSGHKMSKKLLGIISKCFQFAISCMNCNERVVTKLFTKNNNNKENIVRSREKIYKILAFIFDFICFDANFYNNNSGYILEAINNVFSFITILCVDNKQIQDIFDKHLIHKLCRNIPFYFILQPNGQNILFPLLISISLNNKQNLNTIKSSLNIKHLQIWLKRNIYYKNNKNENIRKIPSKMWSNCLRFYNV